MDREGHLKGMFFTYIIYSATLDKYYIGSTQDLDLRLKDHNNSRSKFTRRGKPWVLKWSCSFSTRTEAVREEIRIKKMKSRKYIEQLILKD